MLFFQNAALFVLKFHNRTIYMWGNEDTTVQGTQHNVDVVGMSLEKDIETLHNSLGMSGKIFPYTGGENGCLWAGFVRLKVV